MPSDQKCHHCNGTGEGSMYGAGTVCDACLGMGILTRTPPASEPVPEVAGVVRELNGRAMEIRQVCEGKPLGGHYPVVPFTAERLEIAAALLSAQAVMLEEAREAARALSDRAFQQYRARNGKMCSIEGDDGEACWIIPWDAMDDLRQALAKLEAQSHVG